VDHLPALREHSQEEIEDADFRAVVNPSATIVLPQNATRGETIRHLSNTIPSNDYGLPLFYIRSDLIDWTHIDAYGHVSYDQVEAASELLQYHDGYPTVSSGSPFWSQLKHEPQKEHLLFKAFLDLDENDGIRLIDNLAANENLPLQTIREMSLEYYWSARARSYDLFVVAAEAKRREVRTRKTEDSHFTVAGGILQAVVDRVNDEPDLIKQMDAKDLFDLFEQMVKVQRLSLGLTGANASTNNGLPMNPGQSVELILRSLTKNVGLSGESQDNLHSRLALLMGDENTALVAQELVIRATTDNVVHSMQPNKPATPEGPPHGDG
jgi:hypothetical protein